MIIKSTDKTKKIEPIEGVAFHYVWQLVEFDIIKNGFARHTYKGDLHGGILTKISYSANLNLPIMKNSGYSPYEMDQTRRKNAND